MDKQFRQYLSRLGIDPCLEEGRVADLIVERVALDMPQYIAIHGVVPSADKGKWLDQVLSLPDSPALPLPQKFSQSEGGKVCYSKFAEKYMGKKNFDFKASDRVKGYLALYPAYAGVN